MKTSNVKASNSLPFPVEEAYKTLRTNIRFSSLENKIQTIVVTSSIVGEGKTTTAMNLALVIAHGGHKTILIDCDQRKPRIHKVFEISNERGLSNLLIEEITLEQAIYRAKIDDTESENLYILPSGPKPPNPSELLGSPRMNSLITMLKKNYEYIILDTPPVLIVTDAQIISQYADGCLLVVESGKTKIDDVAKAKSLLFNVNAKIIGVVLNKVKLERKRHYNDYYYDNDKK